MSDEKRLVPRIRFPEFTDDWEQRKFGDLAEYKKGPFGSAITKDMFVPKGEDSIKVYEQQNAINKDWTLERYFLPKEYAFTKLRSFEVHGGDIIVSCAGTIGEIYEIPENAESGIINQALMRVRVNENIVVKNMFVISFSNMIDEFSRIHSNGSAIKNIPPFADLKPMEVFLPSIEEQTKISEYFDSLDNLITLHQCKCDTYKKMKKGMMQKLFNQEIRFKKDDGSDYADWEEKSFNDLFEEYSMTNDGTQVQYTAGKYGLKLMNEEKVRYDISKHKKFNPNSLILGIGIEEVGVSIDTTGCVSPIYTTFAINNTNANTVFVDYYIKGVLEKNKGKITHKSTRRDFEFETKELHKLNSFIPSNIEEQTKIANCLAEFDNLIDALERRLEAYKSLKKAMLQKMFV